MANRSTDQGVVSGKSSDKENELKQYVEELTQKLKKREAELRPIENDLEQNRELHRRLLKELESKRAEHRKLLEELHQKHHELEDLVRKRMLTSRTQR